MPQVQCNKFWKCVGLFEIVFGDASTAWPLYIYYSIVAKYIAFVLLSIPNKKIEEEKNRNFVIYYFYLTNILSL